VADENNTFDIGAVVKLRGPSSAMTVIARGEQPATYLCAWFDANRTLQQHQFPAAVLMRWESRS
jgi:uncharacterized protein YodC (DUF2158 family)